MIRVHLRNTDVEIRTWNFDGRRWRVSIVGGRLQMEEFVMGTWLLLKLSEDAAALLPLYACSWAQGEAQGYWRCLAEERAAFAAGDPEAAAKWKAEARKIAANLERLPCELRPNLEIAATSSVPEAGRLIAENRRLSEAVRTLSFCMDSYADELGRYQALDSVRHNMKTDAARFKDGAA